MEDTQPFVQVLTSLPALPTSMRHDRDMFSCLCRGNVSGWACYCLLLFGHLSRPLFYQIRLANQLGEHFLLRLLLDGAKRLSPAFPANEATPFGCDRILFVWCVAGMSVTQRVE